MKSITTLFSHIYRQPVFWLSIAAAILYSSWPLGFVFNPSVAHHLLASELEAPHQPFNWVFIGMDCSTGLTVCIIGWLQWRRHKGSTLLLASILGYVTFGILVAIAAVSPLNCNPGGTPSCGPLIDDPIVLIHGFASIVSVILLLVSIVALLPLARSHIRKSKMIKALFLVTLGSWALFGIGSLLEMAYGVRGNTLQYYFITICSLSIIFVVCVIEHVGKQDQPLLAEVEDTEPDFDTTVLSS